MSLVAKMLHKGHDHVRIPNSSTFSNISSNVLYTIVIHTPEKAVVLVVFSLFIWNKTFIKLRTMRGL